MVSEDWDAECHEGIKAFVHSQLFEEAANPLAMYEAMCEVADQDHFETALAVREALTEYLAKVEQTGVYPYRNLPGQREKYALDIIELKERLAAIPA